MRLSLQVGYHRLADLQVALQLQMWVEMWIDLPVEQVLMMSSILKTYSIVLVVVLLV